MSNHKKSNHKKPVNKNQPAKKNKSVSDKIAELKASVSPVKIIIAVVAVVLAVALGIGIYYFISNRNKPEKPDIDPVVTVDSGNSGYELAEYKGTKMPVEFVEILNQAELDSYEACEKYGVALELGERNISMPEFVMYYYDIYVFQTESAVYSMQQTGANRTGFDLSVLPGDQKHVREDYTWAEQFTIDVIDNMGLNYMMFDEAVEKGIELDEGAIKDLFDSFEFVEANAEREKRTPDEEIANAYCEGLTAAMYNAREIVVAFATKYDEVRSNELKQSYSDSEVKTEFDKNSEKYSVAKLRVYPIEGEYVEAEALAVKTEQQLIDYANNNHPREDYDAEFSTDCGYLDKERIAAVYGDEVAAWAFENGRKAGDITVVQGMLFRYIVYVEVPAFYTTSCDVMFVGSQYDETMTVEDRQRIFKSEEERYLNWKNEDGTKDGFLKYSTEAGGVGLETIRVGTYHFQIENWIFDPARKSGDYAMLDTAGGCGAVYYVGNNEDDYDWNEKVRTEMATADLKNYQYETLKSDYEVDRKNSVINKAYDAADIIIARHQKKLAERLNQG